MPIGASERDHRLDGKSRMRRESHVRFCERVGVKFPRATRHGVASLLDQQGGPHAGSPQPGATSLAPSEAFWCLAGRGGLPRYAE